MKNVFLAIALFASLSASVAGAYIVQGAKIEGIANTNSNLEKFNIWVSGGTGDCVNRQIVFPRSAAASAEIYERAYAAALTAFASGSKVSIYNYDGASCSNAAYIKLQK